MNIEELGKILNQKRLVRCDIERRVELRRSELADEIRVKLNDEYGAELSAARAEEAKTEAEWRNEKDRENLVASASKLPYPESTILRKWRYECYSKVWRVEYGEFVLQVFREGDKISRNYRWGKRPNVGDIVLRAMKKDGTPSLAVERWNDYMKKSVLPKGQEPIVEQKA
jgi:hypothetical protein